MILLQSNHCGMNVNKIHCSTPLSKTLITENSEKGKVKVVPVQVMQAYRGSTCIITLIVNLSTRGTWVFNFMPRSIYPQERTLVFTELKTLMQDKSTYENNTPYFGCMETQQVWGSFGRCEMTVASLGSITFPVMWPYIPILWHVKLHALHYRHAYVSFDVSLF